MKFNIYHIHRTFGHISWDIPLDEVGELIHTILSMGGEITGVINVEDDQ